MKNQKKPFTILGIRGAANDPDTFTVLVYAQDMERAKAAFKTSYKGCGIVRTISGKMVEFAPVIFA